jgi:hypothetical protein
MEVASTKASLVATPDFADSVTATIPRADFEAALAQEEPAELFLEVKQPTTGDTGDIAVAWERADLERLLNESEGSTITLTFDRTELEGALADVEAHGLREKALILSVAGAAALGGASSAAAAVHDEAGSTARGITPSYVAVHDEASLADRGIQPTVAISHDEATLAARGIQPTVATSHDEATLAARGIEPTVVASHDEASLAARGIDPTVVASHDEASLLARGIRPAVPTAHDEASLTSRGITPATPADSGDGGLTIDVPSIDATTGAAIAGGAAGLALLITAAGFAARRQRTVEPA